MHARGSRSSRRGSEGGRMAGGMAELWWLELGRKSSVRGIGGKESMESTAIAGMVEWVCVRVGQNGGAVPGKE